MRICLDVSAAVHHRAGLGRYAQELMRALLDSKSSDELIVFYNLASRAQPDFLIDGMPRLTTELADKPWRLSVLLAHQVRLSQDRLFPDIDLFHATDHLLPYFTRLKSVLTLNDLTYRLYPQTHRSWNRLFLTLMMPRFLKAADAVISISECTKRDAVRLYGLDAKKIRVIYDGVSSNFRPVASVKKSFVRQKYHLPDRYLLYVGTIEPRKNLEALLEALDQLKQRGRNVSLVIAGKSGWLSEGFHEKRRVLGLEKEVILIGFVPDEDLPALYSAADIFVYPSLYEGFGLPVLEAMACGTPVVCSNTSSLPELVGEAAVLVNPQDVEALSTEIARLLDDEGLRWYLHEVGLVQASRFSWEQTARDTQAIYHQLAS